jgi:hypothetical protein
MEKVLSEPPVRVQRAAAVPVRPEPPTVTVPPCWWTEFGEPPPREVMMGWAKTEPAMAEMMAALRGMNRFIDLGLRRKGLGLDAGKNAGTRRVREEDNSTPGCLQDCL